MLTMELQPILDALHRKVEQETIETGTERAIDLFVRFAKIITTADPAKRGATDWELAARDDVDEDDSAAGDSGSEITSSACTVYGLLLRTDRTSAERAFVVLQDGVNATFDGTAALDNGTVFCAQPVAAAAAGTYRYDAYLFTAGIDVATALDIRADGRDGAAIGANEIDAWILLRGTLA